MNNKLNLNTKTYTPLSHEILFSYYFLGIIFSIFFAYVITDKTFNFFSNSDLLSLAYNYLFLSIIEGKQAVPLRYINAEGQYLPDGTAYMYYGVAPALLRAFFHPFLDLQQIPVARFLVWVQVSASGFVCQSTLLFIIRKCNIQKLGLAASALFLGGISIWLASPLLILTSGASIYHEPIALAFLCTAIFVRAAITLTFSDKNYIFVLLVCAVAAAVSVHARPHVAAALYLGTVALWFWILFIVWQGQKVQLSVDLSQRLPEAKLQSLSFTGLAIGMILGLSGLILLWLVAQRSGTLPGMPPGQTTHGTIFFGLEDLDSVRRLGFLQDGTFNLKRLIPNGIFHALGGWALFEQLREFFGAAYIRREEPFAGFVILWMPWLALACWTITQVALRGIFPIKSGVVLRAAPSLILTGSMALMFTIIVSYGTITFRYKVEMWPILWVLSLFSLPSLLSVFSTLSLNLKRLSATAIIWLVITGSVYSLFKAREYTHVFNQDQVWSYAECVERLKHARTPNSLPDSLCN